jgi:AcrR family transcriptional regulator
VTLQAERLASDALLPPCEGLSDARRRLYEAAVTLFGDRGFHAVSVRDLAASLGLQPGAIYAHVSSKQELLFELMRLGIQTHRDALKGALLDAGREPEDQVRALTREHVLVHLRYQALARMASREARSMSAEQQAELALIRLESERMFRDVIDRGIRLGRFSVSQGELAVIAIGGMGVRVAEWWDPSSSHSPEQIADTYADFAVRLVT